MTKRLIDIDDDLLAAAQRALGTTGISDTVREALDRTLSAAARAAELEWLSAGGMEELADARVRDDVWR